MSHPVDTEKKLPIPWKDIFTSVPFYALLIGDFCSSWGTFIMAISMPTYFKLMVGMNMTKTGILSSLPMLCRYFGAIALGYIADWLLAHNKMTVINVRRFSDF